MAAFCVLFPFGKHEGSRCGLERRWRCRRPLPLSLLRGPRSPPPPPPPPSPWGYRVAPLPHPPRLLHPIASAPSGQTNGTPDTAATITQECCLPLPPTPGSPLSLCARVVCHPIHPSASASADTTKPPLPPPLSSFRALPLPSLRPRGLVRSFTEGGTGGGRGRRDAPEEKKVFLYERVR